MMEDKKEKFLEASILFRERLSKKGISFEELLKCSSKIKDSLIFNSK